MARKRQNCSLTDFDLSSIELHREELKNILDWEVVDFSRELLSDESADKYYFLSIGLILHVHDYRELTELSSSFFPGYYSFYELNGTPLKTIAKPTICTSMFFLTLPNEVRESCAFRLKQKPNFLSATNDIPSKLSFFPKFFRDKMNTSLDTENVSDI